MQNGMPVWLYFLVIASAEVTFILLFHVIYILFSFIAFGEGNNSFMYTKANAYISIFIQFGIPIIINIVKYLKYRNVDQSKTIIFSIAQCLVVALLVLKLITVIGNSIR